jgi:copper chaperone CopZ
MRYYLHYVPGRIRIETPVIHENPPAAAQLETFMKTVPGIKSVETEIITGSAVMYFDEKVLTKDRLITILEKHDYFRRDQAETLDQEIEEGAEKVIKVIADAVLE